MIKRSNDKGIARSCSLAVFLPLLVAGMSRPVLAAENLISDQSFTHFVIVGTIIAFVVLLTWIRKRRNVDTGRIKNLQQIKSIFEGTAAAISLKDMDGKFLLVNNRFASWFNATPEQVVGRTADHFLGQEEMRGIDASDAEVAAGRPSLREEHRLFPDGIRRWVAVHKTPVTSTDGDVVAIATVLTDITSHRQAEEAHRASEQRFKDFAETASDWMWEMDADFRYTYLSDAFEENFGWPPSKSLGRRKHDIYKDIVKSASAETRNKWQAHFADLEAHRPFSNFLQQWETPSGDIRYILNSGKPIFDVDGNFLGYRGTASNVTQEFQAQESLKQSEANLIEAQRIGNIGNWVRDFTTGELLWSDQIYRIFGLSLEAPAPPTTEAFLAIVHEDDRARVRKALSDAVAGNGIYSLSHRIVRPDGQTRILQEEAEVTFGADGKPLRMAGTVQDITELRRAEQALIDSEARLSAVMSIAPSAVITLDRDGAITMFNKGAENTFGYRTEEIIGRPLALLIPERFRSVHADHEAHFLASDVQDRKMSERMEIYGRRKDGSEFPAEASISKIQLADELLVTVILQDITHRRQRDDALRQAQKMEAVGQLTGGVAHDFNNLLQVILSNAELLSPTSDRDTARRNLILRAAERGSNLTESLLAFSRKQSLEPQTVNLLELIDNVADMIRSSVGETVSIKTTTDPHLWTVMADPGQIEIALLNLAVNARDAMPTGGNVTIDCRNVRLDNATVMGSRTPVTGAFVILTVQDDGVGMNANVLEHAIEPFFTTKEVGSGSGLGLSMVYGFARQSGGYIEISSEPGRGTSVSLYLPRSHETASASDRDPDQEAVKGSGERVLVIEDEENVRQAAAHMLEELGYRVAATEDVSAARLAMKRGEKFDLILTDVILPGGVSGPEFAREVLAADENISFVLMSGYAGETFNVDDLLKAGGIMLKKPFRKKQLADAVNEALTRRRVVTHAEP